METMNAMFEEIKVAGSELAGKVKSLLHEGNVSRIVIQDEHGRTLLDVPVVAAAIGAVLAPELAAIGAIAAFASKFTIRVEKSGPPVQA